MNRIYSNDDNNNEYDGANMFRLPFPKRETFNAPSGRHTASLKSVHEAPDKRNPGKSKWRLTWYLAEGGPGRTVYKAGKSYSIDEVTSGEMFGDLERWIGLEALEKMERNGALDLNGLIGKEADLLLTHVKNSSYEHPFVDVTEIHPPGTWAKLKRGN